MTIQTNGILSGQRFLLHCKLLNRAAQVIEYPSHPAAGVPATTTRKNTSENSGIEK
jgi:hypothetical protein